MERIVGAFKAFVDVVTRKHVPSACQEYLDTVQYLAYMCSPSPFPFMTEIVKVQWLRRQTLCPHHGAKYAFGLGGCRKAPLLGGYAGLAGGVELRRLQAFPVSKGLLLSCSTIPELI